MSVGTSGRGLTLGEQAVRVLSVKEFPSSMMFGDALRYLSDPYGGEPPLKERYLVAVTVYFPNPMKLESTLDKHQKWGGATSLRATAEIRALAGGPAAQP